MPPSPERSCDGGGVILAMIAALALRHHHPLVTRDAAFHAVPGPTVDPH